MRPAFTRPVLLGLGILLVAAVVFWVALPRLIINYLEKHDREWINRDIRIEKLRINPFTASATLQGLEVSERDSAATFLGLDQAYGNLDPWALWGSEIRVEEARVEGFFGRAIQEGAVFNFSDLLELFEAGDSSSTASPWSFRLDRLRLGRSSADYEDRQLGSHLELDSIYLHVDTFSSQDLVLRAAFGLAQPEGGSLAGELLLRGKTGDLEVQAVVEQFNIQPFQAYLDPYIDLGVLRGRGSADLNLRSNIKSRDFVAVSGRLEADEVLVAEPDLDTLVTLGHLGLDIDSLDTRSSLYDFGAIGADDIFVHFEYLPDGDNFTRLLRMERTLPGTEAAAATEAIDSTEASSVADYYYSPFEYLALYAYDLTREYIFRAYSVDTVAVRNFDLELNDYTLEDPFFLDIDDLDLSAGGIQVTDSVAEFQFEGTINRTGTLRGEALVSRDGFENMDLHLELQGVFLSGFSPYSRFYTAHPLLEGAVSISSQNHIEGYYLTSSHRIFAEDIEVGPKAKTQRGYSLPLRLAVVLLRDKDRNIDLEVPIEGPLNDPKIKFSSVIWQVLKNLVTKIVTAPFRLLADAFSLDEEDLKTIRFAVGQTRLEERQLKSLRAVSVVLEKKPELDIKLEHLYNRDYELEALAVQKVKLAYLQSLPPDSLPINVDTLGLAEAALLPSGDSLFQAFLRTEVPNFDSTQSLAENTLRHYGYEAVQDELDRILQMQKDLVGDYLTQVGGFAPNRFLIRDASQADEAVNQSYPVFRVSFQTGEDDPDEPPPPEPG